jgi:NAD(P)-dependent dehydrogenase (short-subunit alcohol dehydrogenase family)
MDKKVAIVTGSARGIGRGIAKHLATSGYAVVLNGVSPAPQPPAIGALEDAKAEIESAGGTAACCRGDVAISADRQKLIDFTRQTFGRLDLLVNNAGTAPKVRADILDANEDSFDQQISTNLKGPYFLTKLAANWMVEQRKTTPDFRGCIINISSFSATVPSINRGDYCISKAGIAMTTKLWAARLAEFGIDVYEIRPGIIATDMTAGVKGKYDALINSDAFLNKRWGTPDDIGRAAATLARGDIPYATGTVLVLDGGYTLQRL